MDAWTVPSGYRTLFFSDGYKQAATYIDGIEGG